MGWFKKTSAREESTPSAEAPIEPTMSKRSTYLGKNLNVTGSIVGRDDVQIFGRHTGGIQIEGDLDIRESATIEGNIKARSVKVGGTAKGDLVADSKLHIQRTGKVNGNISTSVIILNEGAVFNGEVNMYNR
jgi:cytoskeletal protein CcmA (bactofilin family)